MDNFRAKIKKIKKEGEVLEVTFEKKTKIVPQALIIRYKVLKNTFIKVKSEMDTIEDLAKIAKIQLE